MPSQTQTERNARAVVEEWFRLMNELAKGNVSDYLHLYDKDTIMTLTGQTRISVTTRGHDELQKFFEAVGDTMKFPYPDACQVPWEVIEEGNKIVVLSKAHVMIKRGVPYNNNYFFLFEVRNGKIVREVEILDDALTEVAMFDSCLRENVNPLPLA